MRRRTIAECGLVLGLLASLPAVSSAQPSINPRRPQPKIVTFEPVKETSAVVGVIGHVGRPGTYQFASAPTMELVIAAAEGTTEGASDMVRLVHGGRVTQAVTYRMAANEKLQSGDLVIVDGDTKRRHFDPATGKEYVWLAFVGVIKNRPCVMPVEIDHAFPQLLVQKLGQPQSLLPSVRTFPPPGAALRSTAGQPLADGTILFFDPTLIQAHDLPNDLPPILPCGLPEPEIGAYGLNRVQNAYEERRDHEEIPSRELNAPQQNLLLPGDRDRSDASPIPLPEEPSPTIAATKQSAGSPTISTIPYSTGPSPIVPRRHRLTGLEPPRQSHALDTQSPSWNKGQASTGDQFTDSEIDTVGPPQSNSGALKLWQMFAILSGAGLLVGIALAARALQSRRRGNTSHSSPLASEIPPSPALHEPKSVIPAPHLPARSFVATAVPRTSPATAANEELSQRQRAFVDLLNHRFPIIEEPLSLRPGIPLGSPAVDQTIWRRDAGIVASEAAAPHLNAEPAVGIPGARQHLDPPHPRLSSGPHLRIGPEAPVERALRQLQGGRS